MKKGLEKLYPRMVVLLCHHFRVCLCVSSDFLGSHLRQAGLDVGDVDHLSGLQAVAVDFGVFSIHSVEYLVYTCVWSYSQTSRLFL